MSLKKSARKAGIYAKLVAYLVKKLAAALGESITTGYIKSRDIRSWVLNHLGEFIPTKIDNAILDAADVIDDKTTKVFDRLHSMLADSLRDDSTWNNLILELNQVNDEIDIENQRKKAQRAKVRAENKKFAQAVKERMRTTIYGEQFQTQEQKESYNKARQEWVGNNKFRDIIAPKDTQVWEQETRFP